MTQQSEEFARIRAYLQSQAAEKTIDELVERVQEGVADLEAAVRSIPAGRLDTVPPNEQPDGWSFRQCLEHSLGGNMGTALDVLYTAHTGELPTTDPDPVGDSIDAMLATHANAIESVIAHVKDADPGAFLDIRWEHPMFGPLNWREWFLFLRIHSKDHARQIVGMVESMGS